MRFQTLPLTGTLSSVLVGLTGTKQKKNQCSFLSECQYVHLSAIWAGCQGRIRTSKTLLKHLQCDTWMVWSRLLCSTAGGLSSSISAWSVFVSFSSNAQSLLKSVVFRTWLHEDSSIFSVYLINETQKPTPTLPHTILYTTLEANLIILNILGLKDELHTTSDSDSLLANLYIYIFTTTNRHQSSQTLSDSALLSTIGSTPFFRKTSKALLVAWPMPRSELRNSWRLTQSRWQECSTAFSWWRVSVFSKLWSYSCKALLPSDATITRSNEIKVIITVQLHFAQNVLIEYAKNKTAVKWHFDGEVTMKSRLL